jgi:hypothetical protein
MAYIPKKSGRFKKIPMPDFSRVRQGEMSAIAGISPQTLNAWDCPRNDDGTYNTAEVWKWRENKLSGKSSGRDDLEKQKLELQIEKMGIEINEMKEKNIPLETHEQILCNRAEGLRLYWVETFAKNLHLFCHKSIEQLRPLSERFIRESLNQYSKNHK